MALGEATGTIRVDVSDAVYSLEHLGLLLDHHRLERIKREYGDVPVRDLAHEMRRRQITQMITMHDTGIGLARSSPVSLPWTYETMRAASDAELESAVIMMTYADEAHQAGHDLADDIANGMESEARALRHQERTHRAMIRDECRPARPRDLGTRPTHRDRSTRIPYRARSRL